MADVLAKRRGLDLALPTSVPATLPDRPAAPSQPTPRRRRHLLLMSGGVLALLVLGSSMLITSTDPDQGRLADLLSTAASWVAFGCCLVAATSTRGAVRRSWGLFATTMGMWAVADTIWIASSVAGTHPLLSVADYLYLFGIVPSVVGLVAFPAGTWERGARSRLVLDATVLGGGLLLCSQLLVLNEVSALNDSAWDTVVYEIYPVTDVLLAGLAVLLLIRTAGRPRLDLALVALAFATWTATDNGYALLSSRGEEYTGTLVAVGYLVAPLLLGLAALSSPVAAMRPRTIRRHLTGTVSAWLPDLAVLVAIGLVLTHGLGSWQDWAMAGVVLSLTTVRQLAQTSDNHTMRLDLERKVEDRTAELRRLSEQHRGILEAVGEGIVGVDMAGDIVFVNPAAATMLGSPAEALVGRPACATLCHERHEHCLIDMVLAVGDVVRSSETTYARSDGSTFPVEIMAAPKTGPDGPTGVVIGFRDITERRAMDRMKREFVTSVSHELRTPLTAIRGSLEMLVDGDTGELPPESLRAVAMAVRGSERLTRLVNDILDVERLDSGAFTVHPAPHDVRPLIASTVASMVPLAREFGVTLRAEEVSGRALCDPDRLVQALTNLVGNALKFSPPDSVVEVQSRPVGHEVVVTVRDHGRGIPPDHLEAIFDRFHQVEGADVHERGGTGLGLTITRSIVERHGGQIDVESVVGEGTTFRFTLPACD